MKAFFGRYAVVLKLADVALHLSQGSRPSPASSGSMVIAFMTRLSRHLLSSVSKILKPVLSEAPSHSTPQLA
jgi:hypothetical protein